MRTFSLEVQEQLLLLFTLTACEESCCEKPYKTGLRCASLIYEQKITFILKRFRLETVILRVLYELHVFSLRTRLACMDSLFYFFYSSSPL